MFMDAKNRCMFLVFEFRMISSGFKTYILSKYNIKTITFQDKQYIRFWSFIVGITKNKVI